jgi:hypothetical protein
MHTSFDDASSSDCFWPGEGAQTRVNQSAANGLLFKLPERSEYEQKVLLRSM